MMELDRRFEASLAGESQTGTPHRRRREGHAARPTAVVSDEPTAPTVTSIAPTVTPIAPAVVDGGASDASGAATRVVHTRDEATIAPAAPSPDGRGDSVVLELQDRLRTLDAQLAERDHELAALRDQLRTVNRSRRPAAVTTPASSGAAVTWTGTLLKHLALELVRLNRSLNMGETTTSLADRIAQNLARAQVTRIKWLVEAWSQLHYPPALTIRPVQVSELLDATRRTLKAEARLRGIHVRLAISDDLPDIGGDHALLECGTVGAALATIDLIGSAAPGATLTLGARHEPSSVVLFVQQAGAVPDGALTARMLDTGWADRPGGWMANAAVAIARAAAERHHGAATFTASASGTSFRLELPRPG
ncbi:MAG: hypothetical protein AB7Q29_10980 [Vicinamibacterales bacterium]